MTSRSAVTWCLVFAVALLLPLNQAHQDRTYAQKRSNFLAAILCFMGFYIDRKATAHFLRFFVTMEARRNVGRSPLSQSFFRAWDTFSSFHIGAVRVCLPVIHMWNRSGLKVRRKRSRSTRHISKISWLRWLTLNNFLTLILRESL